MRYLIEMGVRLLQVKESDLCEGMSSCHPHIVAYPQIAEMRIRLTN